jgi:UDP-2-acetamido-2-deoxy-ribo-hexuluronate aminotransferase
MDTLQCAVVLAKLERFDWEIERRQKIAERYDRLFTNSSTPIQLLRMKPDRTSSYAQYTLLVPDRERVQQRMSAAGVPTAVHYPIPMHRQPAYEALCVDTQMPVSEWVAERVISLPMHADLDESTQDRIVVEFIQTIAGS